jgi:hypothetical protein
VVVARLEVEEDVAAAEVVAPVVLVVLKKLPSNHTDTRASSLLAVKRTICCSLEI